MKYLVLFNGKNGYANAPQYYVIHIFPAFFIVSTAALSYRKPAPVGTSRDSFRAHGHDERNVLYVAQYHNAVLCTKTTLVGLNAQALSCSYWQTDMQSTGQVSL
jgi:hypothetical protein